MLKYKLFWYDCSLNLRVTQDNAFASSQVLKMIV